MKECPAVIIHIPHKKIGKTVFAGNMSEYATAIDKIRFTSQCQRFKNKSGIPVFYMHIYFLSASIPTGTTLRSSVSII